MQEGTYFVTFRLFNSLPWEVTHDLEIARAAQSSPMIDWRSIEEALDRCAGACYLRRPVIARIVKDAIEYLNGKSYELIAWVVMPNHVHLVIRLLPGFELSGVMHQIKSFSAKQANRALRRSGSFWQREYYDRLLRRREFDRAVEYVRDNPKKAGLHDWHWVGPRE